MPCYHDELVTDRMIDDSAIDAAAGELFTALQQAKPIDPLTGRWPSLSIDDAYGIQQRLIRRRVSGGARVVGKKIGVTSQAVMTMLGVDQPDFGVLLSDMVFPRGAEISMASLIQPKAEGEIAFVLKRDLLGPGLTAVDILTATEGVMACFEIVDSRIRDWKIKIQDTVADNASCGAFVLSDRLVPIASANLYSCGMVLERNGQIAGVGAGAASMGSPVNAVVWLANALGRRGVPLLAGEVILSGALSAMVPVQAGDQLRLEIDGIGDCSVRFTP